jgi:hypothetical protein
MMQNLQSIPVTPQEIAMYRQKDARPQVQSMSDEAIKQMIQKQKLIYIQKQKMQQQQQSQPQLQQHPQQQQLPFGPTSAIQPQLQVPQQIQQRQTIQRPQQRPQSQQQRPGMPVSNNNMSMSTPKGLGPPKPSPTPQPLRGTKRPASEDIMEIPPPNQSPAMATQMQPSMPQHRASSATGQRPQAGQQAIMVSNSSQKDNGPKEDVMKQLKDLIAESNIADAVARKPPPGPITAAVRQSLVKQIEQAKIHLSNLDTAIQEYLSKTKNSEMTKQYLKLRTLLRQNIDFQTMTLAKDLSHDPGLLQRTINECMKFVAGVFMKYRSEAAARQQHQSHGNQNDATAATQQTSSTPAQLNAVNLDQHNQALRQQQAVQRRSHIKTPAAPTVGPGHYPPFISSPQGVPKYDGASNFSTENLKIPEKKKQRTGSQAQSTVATPAQATPGSAASPAVGKSVSPKMRRKQTTESGSKEAPKPVLPFKCAESGCDKAFETQEQLEAHKDAHLHIEDFFIFALENVAQAVGLNPDGTSKEPTLAKAAEPQKQVAKTVVEATKSSTSPPSVAMARASSTQTAIKAESPAQPLPKTPSQQAIVKLATAPTSETGTTTTDIKPTSTDIKPCPDPVATEPAAEDPLLTDPWSTSTLKPLELQELFKQVDCFPTIVDNWEFPVDDPVWPNFKTEDAAEEPNTTPSATSKDTVDTIDSTGPATLADEEQGEEEKVTLVDPVMSWMSWPEDDNIDFGYPWIEEMGEVLHPVEYKEGMTAEEKLQALDDAAREAFAKDKVPGW